MIPINKSNPMLYAVIISLDAEGITEQIDFTIDELLMVSSDDTKTFNMRSNDI